MSRGVWVLALLFITTYSLYTCNYSLIIMHSFLRIAHYLLLIEAGWGAQPPLVGRGSSIINYHIDILLNVRYSSLSFLLY